MAYSLTVVRVMGVCAFEVTSPPQRSRRSSVKVSKEFYAQLGALNVEYLNQIYSAIIKGAAKLNVTLQEHASKPGELALMVVQEREPGIEAEQLFEPPVDQPVEVPTDEPIVGLFRPRRFTMTIGEQVWDLRIRPSVTACVLEDRNRLSKLWWTFEGVPVGPSSEADSVRFVEVATALAEAAVPALRTAYTKTLETITGKSFGRHRMEGNQLRVVFADNTDSSFSRLVDAMSLSSVPFEEAASMADDPKLRAGASEVESFITKTTGHKADPSEITYSTGQGGLAAVYTKPVEELTSKPGAEKYAISGLASSIGMISNSQVVAPQWIQAKTSPDMVRSISAARPLSAWIADTGARQLDRRTGARQLDSRTAELVL